MLLQAAFSSSYSCALLLRPLRSTIITRFFATTSLSDSLSEHQRWLCFPFADWSGALPFPPRRVSQVPRFVFRCAPSSITPKDSTVALTRCFTADSGLHLSWAGWPSLFFCVTRPNRVRFHYGSQLRAARASPQELLPATPRALHVIRATYMATSFQVARQTRLVLAHPCHTSPSSRWGCTFSSRWGCTPVRLIPRGVAPRRRTFVRPYNAARFEMSFPRFA